MRSMDNNAPIPQTELSAELSDNTTVNYKLFKVSGICLATFLGSIFAGGLLMTLNFTRLGKEAEAKKTLLHAGLATVFIILLVFLTPKNMYIPNTILTIAQVILAYHYVKKYQAAEIDSHIENGGLTNSNWKAAGIALLVLMVVVVA